MQIPYKFVLGVGLTFILTSQSSAASFAVIANKSPGETKLEISQVREIYLGNRSFWGSGERIRMARLEDEDPLTKDFLTYVTSMNVQGYLQLWRRKLFAGKALPPRKFSSSKEMIDYVANTEGAIGFVGRTENLDQAGVQVIELDE